MSYALASAAARDELALILDNITPSADASALVLSKLLVEPAASGITAFAGGGQASATQIVAEVNRITTVATTGDSVKLPSAAAGLTIMLINAGANPMQVFGLGTDTIDGQAAATGVSQMQNSVVLFVCAVAGSWQTEGLATGFSGSYQTLSAKDGIVAFAGGGQASGTALPAMLNRIVTVVTAADSVKLPASAPGMTITVTNAAAANSANVFPATGDQINALGANAAFALAAGKTAEFVCHTAGQWHALLSA